MRLQASLAALTLLTLAACAAPPPGCPLQAAADFPVTYLPGHIPAITIQIRRQNLLMMVDTGAAASYLTSAAYNRMNTAGLGNGGLSATGIVGYSTGVGGGTMQESFATMQDAQLGGARLKDQVFLVNDDYMTTRKGQTGIDGVVGADILDEFNVGLDLPDNRIMLFYSQHCDGGMTPWPGDYASAPITFHPGTLEHTVPYRIGDQTLAMVVDTGATLTLVSQPSLDRLGVKPEAAPADAILKARAIGHHIVRLRGEEFSDAEIGAESFDHIWLTVSPKAVFRDVDGLLGEDYLAKHRLFLNYGADIAYFGLTTPPLN